MSPLSLRLVTRDGRCEDYPCDSIRLPMADDKKGRGGGSMGIRKGFPNAVIALQAGRAEALRNGSPVFAARITGGFALVEDGRVTLCPDAMADP